MYRTTRLLAHTDVDTTDSTGAALLCLPGWCGGREVFDPLLAHTAHEHRSVSLDWPGHGDSPLPGADFCTADLVAEALELIDALSLQEVVPVALSHAGWVALELRRRLGPDRVPGVVLVDWMPLGTPPGFTEALQGLQDANAWQNVRAALFAMWGEGVTDRSVHRYISTMGEYGFDMWSRAGREIGQAFAETPVPLTGFAALAGRGEPCPTMHVYAQPRDEGFLAAQQGFAVEHEWFTVSRLDARSHFPSLEVPDRLAEELDKFVAGLR